MEEIWRDIKGYEGLYQVSNLGNVKSLERIDSHNHLVKEKIKKPFTNKGGYLRVFIHKDGKGKKYNLHRLVAEAFPEICGEMFKDCHVDHIDTNKENNNADNLRCVTPRENSNNPLTKIHLSESNKGKKCSEETKKKISQSKKGQNFQKKQEKECLRHTKVKNSPEETIKKIVAKTTNGKKSKSVLQIDPATKEVIAEFPSIMEVHRKLGFDNSAISKCCLEKQKTYKGFIWKFK